MHHFHYSLFALALVGCADSARIEDEDPGEASEGDLTIHPGDPPGRQTLDVSYELSQPRCDAMLAFELLDATRADGTPVTNPDCFFAFDDGAVVNACAGEHSFAEGNQFHGVRVSVIDRETGEFFVEETRRFVQPAIEPFLAARQIDCELGIEVVASHNVTAFSIVTVSPEENVVGDSFRQGQGTHRFEVTQSGSFEVTYFIEDERSIPICTATVAQRVEVVDCNQPPCDHVSH